MGFIFRHDSLLRYREFRLTEARRAFAAARKALDATRARLVSVRHSLTEERTRFAAEQRQGVPARDYLLYRDYLASIEFHLSDLERQEEEQSKTLEETKENLLARKTDVKMIELLKARMLLRYREIQGKRERVRLDERAHLIPWIHGENS
jgi:flagellar export protein FliJ